MSRIRLAGIWNETAFYGGMLLTLILLILISPLFLQPSKLETFVPTWRNWWRVLTGGIPDAD